MLIPAFQLKRLSAAPGPSATRCSCTWGPTRCERTAPWAPRLEGPGPASPTGGTRLAPETARRLCCDTAMVCVERDDTGNVLDIGRRARTIPPAIDRAVRIRDGGCRFPGCGVRFTDGHHVRHWADGGTTSLANLLSLCVYHHRKLHEGGWKLQYDADADIPTFVDPRGHVRYDARPRERISLFGDEATHGDGVASHRAERSSGNGAASNAAADVSTGQRAARALADINHARGITPDGEALRARYRRDIDIPWDVHARALEALDEAHFGP